MQVSLTAFSFLVLRFNATLPQNNPLQSRSCLRRYAFKNGSTVQEPYLKKNVYLENWNPDWEQKFDLESAQLKTLLGKNCLAIHHIGSTAINGIKAKPIIDVLVVVKSFSSLDAVDFSNYEIKGANGIEGRQYFQKDINGVRMYHIHMYENGHKNIASHLYFRDSLRNNSKLAQSYEQLKVGLAKKYSDNKAAYTAAKSNFIQQVIGSA